MSLQCNSPQISFPKQEQGQQGEFSSAPFYSHSTQVNISESGLDWRDYLVSIKEILSALKTVE